MKLATNGSAGDCDELGRCAALEDPAVDDHADPVGERGGVLEVVGDEDGRQRELAEQLVQLDPHRRLRVGVERRQRLVEQEHAGLERERARERDALALAAGQLADAGRRQVRDLEPLEQLVARARRVRHRSGRSRARRGAGTARTPGTGSRTLRRSGGTSMPAVVSSQVRSPSVTTPIAGPQQPGDDPQHRRLAGSRRTDERRRGAVGDGQLDGRVEAAKGMGEVDAERHRVRSLTERRVTALMITSTALIASATLKSRSNCS